MVTTTLPILNLKKGIRINEFSSVEELDSVMGEGTALKYANEWVGMLLRDRAKSVIAITIEEKTGLIRRENEDSSNYVKRWLNKQGLEEGVPMLQSFCDSIEPFTLSTERALPSRPDKHIIERARVIFNNQRHIEWVKTLCDEGIVLPMFTGQHDTDVMILAGGLKRLNNKQIKRDFV